MQIRSLILCGLAALSLSSTSTLLAAEGGNTSRAQFLQKVWVAKAYRGKPVYDKFSAVYVAPVSTRLLENQNWWKQQGARKGQLKADARTLAKQTRSAFQNAFANYRGRKLRVASSPGPGVLVLEVALVELVPAKAYWNAGATAAGFVLPGAGFLAAAGSGSVGIEGRLRDGGSKTVIATFKDRRKDKVAAVNVAGMKWYRGSEGNILDWAGEFAEVLNSTNTVGRSARFALAAW